jgi:hypothetical protein
MLLRNVSEPLDSDLMAKEFSMQFSSMVFTRGQEIIFEFNNPQKNVSYHLPTAAFNILMLIFIIF